MLWNQPNFRRNSVLALLLASLLCANVVAPAFAQSVSQPPEPTTAVVELPIEEEELFNLFQEIKDTILLLYPKLVDVVTLYQGAIRGLFESLDDPYSEYLDKEEFESLSQDMEGEFSGIGVAIQLISSNITVVSVFKGSPAQKAGMQPGDVIIKVDGTDLRGKKLQDASALLRGEPGTRVTVTVLRPRTGESLVLPMIRTRISAHPIEMEELGDGMFYIRISQFTSTTGKNFSVLMDFLRRKEARGLLLDLRDNPGGLLDGAVDVAGELVPSGPIVELRRKNFRQVISSDKQSNPIPTIILINGGTASASEIVAGAVRDRGKGILVGERTFGKACVQALIPIADDAGGFKLTVAEYYTPSGEMISGVGLKPNIAVEQERIQLPDTVVYSREMKRGTVGLDVLALQTSLEFLGYDPGTADGIFGPKTEGAFLAFMCDYGREYRGSVGESEVSTINGAVSEKAVNVPDNVLEEGKFLLKHWLEMH